MSEKLRELKRNADKLSLSKYTCPVSVTIAYHSTQCQGYERTGAPQHSDYGDRHRYSINELIAAQMILNHKEFCGTGR